MTLTADPEPDADDAEDDDDDWPASPEEMQLGTTAILVRRPGHGLPGAAT